MAKTPTPRKTMPAPAALGATPGAIIPGPELDHCIRIETEVEQIRSIVHRMSEGELKRADAIAELDALAVAAVFRRSGIADCAHLLKLEGPQWVATVLQNLDGLARDLESYVPRAALQRYPDANTIGVDDPRHSDHPRNKSGSSFWRNLA